MSRTNIPEIQMRTDHQGVCMKRSIAIVLMVILALFLFVACDDGKASDSYCTVSFDPNGGTVTAVGGDFSPSNFADGIGAGASESECGTLKIGPQVALYGDNTDGNTHIGDGPMDPYTGERFKVMGAMKKTAPFTKHVIIAP